MNLQYWGFKGHSCISSLLLKWMTIIFCYTKDVNGANVLYRYLVLQYAASARTCDVTLVLVYVCVYTTCKDIHFITCIHTYVLVWCHFKGANMNMCISLTCTCRYNLKNEKVIIVLSYWHLQVMKLWCLNVTN